MRLVISGARATKLSDRKSSSREMVPVERIAAACTPITNAAATTAETTWDASRVRLGPRLRNSATETTTATAVDSAPIAQSTPYPASHRPPS
jgi:hypothetical protein